MFVCKECHTKKGFKGFHIFGSLGPCEVCGKSSWCYVCNCIVAVKPYKPDRRITRVEKFSCPICGFLTEDPTTIERIKQTHSCPVCHDGKTRKYELKRAVHTQRPHVC